MRIGANILRIDVFVLIIQELNCESIATICVIVACGCDALACAVDAWRIA